MGRHDTPDRKAAMANEAMLDLLYGPNPITDDELRALIKKRPALYAKYAGYLGKRPGQGPKRDAKRKRSTPTYGDKRDYPKIDIYVDGDYVATTTWARTLATARSAYAKSTGTSPSRIRAHFRRS